MTIEPIVKWRARRGARSSCPLDPAAAGDMPAGAGLAPFCEDGFRNLKRLMRPVQRIPSFLDLVCTERRSMDFFSALAVRRAETNDRTAGDQRRPVAASGPFDRGRDRLGIVAVDPASRPSGSLEPCDLVIRTGQRW